MRNYDGYEVERALREVQHMTLSDAISIPASLAPEGWEYALIACSIGKDSHPCEARMMEAKNKGKYRMVPRSRHPDLAASGFRPGANHVEDRIQIEGLVLMERPIIIGDAI